ncbi:MAG TPA: cysteine hydrolase [Xanthomonadaceae bacterium]|nr:cysteine hydrolase [Xanthomonadaceae bacterium]
MNTSGNPALLIIDMISAFDFPEATPLAPHILAAARTIRRLRARFHALGLPVIYANDNFANWRTDFAGLVAMASASGALGAQVSGMLEPDAADYFILKPKHSAFLATALPVLLAKLGVRRLFLTGMTADSCVLATAMDANAREYRVAVVSDGVAGMPGAKKAALAAMKASTAGEIVGAGAVLRDIG